MQTAVPAGTAVFRGKWKRTDSRFAAFGGRGASLPLSPHRNAPSGHSGVPHGLFSDSAPTHLRCAGVPLGLFGKPKRSSFSRVRGLHQAILWPLLQSARPPGSLRSPSDAAPKCFFKTSRCSARLIRQAETLELQPRSRPPSSHTMAFAPKRSTSRFAPLTLRCRTEMFFQNIPVFRSAYSASRNTRASAAFAASIKPYYGLCSKTLDLQVRSAHPPMPHRNVFSKLSGVPLGLFGKPKRSSFSRFAAFGGRGSFAPPCTPLSRRPPDTGRTASKAPLEGSWRAAPEGWVRHGDAQFCGIEERRFRLRLTGLHAFCRRQRLWNQSVWPSRTCRAKALMSEKAGQSRPAPPASPSSCTSEPAVMSK